VLPSADVIINCQIMMPPCAADLGLQQWQLQGREATAVRNSLHELVHVHQQLLSSKEELQDELHRMSVEAKTADKTIQRLQDSNDQKAQDLGGLHIKASNCSATCPSQWWHGKTIGSPFNM